MNHLGELWPLRLHTNAIPAASSHTAPAGRARLVPHPHPSATTACSSAAAPDRPSTSRLTVYSPPAGSSKLASQAWFQSTNSPSWCSSQRRVSVQALSTRGSRLSITARPSSTLTEKNGGSSRV